MNFINKYKFYFLAFILLESFAFAAIKYQKDLRVKHYLEEQTIYIEKEYNTVYNKYKLLSKHTFNTLINKKNIISIFNDIHDTNKKDELKNLKRKLFGILKDDYNYLKIIGFNTIHFHFPNDKNFLDMDNYKNNDNMSNISYYELDNKLITLMIVIQFFFVTMHARVYIIYPTFKLL